MMNAKHSLLFICLCAALAACDRQENSFQSLDSNAKLYRMYVERAAGEGTEDETVDIHQFPGQLRMADLDSIFGAVDKLPTDLNGNRIGGWKVDRDLLWHVIISPSGSAVSLVSTDLNGTSSSAMDLDGDRIADIVDIRTGDGERFSFVTELGREIFQHWLQRRNPLCDEQILSQLSITGFGCSDGEGGGTGGSASGAPQDAGIADPFDAICSEYRDSRRTLRPPVHMDGGHGYGSEVRYSYVTSGWGDGGQAIAGTRVYRDADGNHVATYTRITYYDSDRNIVRVIDEQVDNDGNGERTVTDYGADGTTKSESETFETDVDEDGYYDVHLENHERAPESGDSNSGDTPDTGADTSDPGIPPGEDLDTDMEAWCEATQPRESGFERAAAFDPTSFGLGCDDIAYTGNGGDCRIFEWAGPADFEGALAEGASNCGAFEQPGPDGTCGPASGIERLRGLTAWLGSIQLEEVEICNPLVCNPSP